VRCNHDGAKQPIFLNQATLRDGWIKAREPIVQGSRYSHDKSVYALPDGSREVRLMFRKNSVISNW